MADWQAGLTKPWRLVPGGGRSPVPGPRAGVQFWLVIICAKLDWTLRSSRRVHALSVILYCQCSSCPHTKTTIVARSAHTH